MKFKEVQIYQLVEESTGENLMYGTLHNIKKFAITQIDFDRKDSISKKQFDDFLKYDFLALDFLEEIGFKATPICLVSLSDFFKSKRL